MSTLARRAWMARNGIAPNQLMPWHSPDNGYTDPLDDPEVRAALRMLVADVWRRSAQEEPQ